MDENASENRYQNSKKKMADKKTINFSGYVWEVRSSGDGGPGPNHWSSDNVWVDQDGYLHLKITQQN